MGCKERSKPRNQLLAQDKRALHFHRVNTPTTRACPSLRAQLCPSFCGKSTAAMRASGRNLAASAGEESANNRDRTWGDRSFKGGASLAGSGLIRNGAVVGVHPVQVARWCWNITHLGCIYCNSKSYDASGMVGVADRVRALEVALYRIVYQLKTTSPLHACLVGCVQAHDNNRGLRALSDDCEYRVSTRYFFFFFLPFLPSFFDRRFRR